MTWFTHDELTCTVFSYISIMYFLKFCSLLLGKMRKFGCGGGKRKESGKIWHFPRWKKDDFCSCLTTCLVQFVCRLLMLDLMLVRTEKEPDGWCDWRWLMVYMFGGAVAFMIDAIRKQCYPGKGYSFGAVEHCCWMQSELAADETWSCSKQHLKWRLQ